MGLVAALRNDFHPHVRHPLAPGRGPSAGQNFVLRAPQHQGRHRDAMQPALERGIEPARLPAELGGHEAVDQLELGLLFGRHARQPLLGQRLIVEHVAGGFLRRPDEIVAGRHALDPYAGGREQRQRREPRAVAHGELGRDPAAERMADQVHALDAQAVEHVEVIHRHVLHVADPGRVVGLAEAGMLGNEQLVFAGQSVEERKVARKPAGAVQEHHRLAAASAEHPHADVADLVSLFLESHRPVLTHAPGARQEQFVRMGTRR